MTNQLRTCQDIHLTLHCFDELPDETKKALQDHLAVCFDCQQKYDGMSRMLHSLPAMDAGIDNKDVRRFTEKVMSRTRSRRRPVFPTVFGGAMAAAAAFLLVLTFNLTGPQKPEQPLAESAVTLSAAEEMEMLEDMELLENLETLKALALEQS